MVNVLLFGRFFEAVIESACAFTFVKDIIEEKLNKILRRKVVFMEIIEKKSILGDNNWNILLKFLALVDQQKIK